MANSNLTNAKNAKNDEFYTQWVDIENEINAYLNLDPDVFKGKTILCPCDDPYESNFFKYFALRFYDLQLKKLIATCYAGSPIANKQLSLFPDESEEVKTTRNPHKIEITEIPDMNNDGAVNLYDVQLLLASDRNHLTRLKGNGDFRSKEIKQLRDEADIIITNPPFSLFREFLTWIMEANKQFLIIGSKNAITYKEVFPLIKDNKMWIGAASFNKDMLFIPPEEIRQGDKPSTATRIVDGKVYLRSPSVWFTNIDHGRRHQPLPLMLIKDNLRYNKKLKGKVFYDRYDNYDAIEIPYTESIPSNYYGVMGVPVSFLDKYSPEQFEIMGMCENLDLYKLKTKTYSSFECQQAYLKKFGKKGTYDLNASGVIIDNGLLEKVYQRILIRHKKNPHENNA